MSIEEAIKILAFDEEYFHTEEECEAYIMAIEALKEKNERKQEWIPCSERLPEVGGLYIVTEKRFAIDDRKHNGRYQTIVEEVNFSNNKWNRANFFEIVAWMPLPEPYGKEESK